MSTTTQRIESASHAVAAMDDYSGSVAFCHFLGALGQLCRSPVVVPSDVADAVDRALIYATIPEVADFIGQQEGGEFPICLFNLKREMPGLTVGSTYSLQTLAGAIRAKYGLTTVEGKPQDFAAVESP